MEALLPSRRIRLPRHCRYALPEETISSTLFRIRTLRWCSVALRRHISVRRQSMASCVIHQPTRSGIERIVVERPVGIIAATPLCRASPPGVNDDQKEVLRAKETNVPAIIY